MPARISVEVTQFRQSCRFLLSALTRQGEKVADLLHSLVQPHLVEGDEAPGFLASIVGLGRRLSSSLDALIDADRKLFEVNASLSTLRTRRNELSSDLGNDIVRLRQAVLAVYLKPDLEALALQSPRLYRADPLLNQTDLLLAAFERDDLATLLGEGITEDTPVPLASVKRVENTAEELRSALVGIDEARRDFDEAVLAKTNLKFKHEEVFIFTARSFEAFCRLADEKDLAERVRPSEQRRGRLEQEPDDDAPDEGTTANEGGLAASGSPSADEVDEGDVDIGDVVVSDDVDIGDVVRGDVDIGDVDSGDVDSLNAQL